MAGPPPVSASPGRSRALLAAIAALLIVVGLATRRLPTAFPELVGRYGGDTLWAALVYFLCALARPAASPRRLASTAFAFSVLVELSQLLRWPWLSTLRSTRMGSLVLGHGFLWTDIGCYAAGIACAFALDKLMQARRRA
jgi:hypothetical protein